MDASIRTCDVLVVGAGPAGAASALALARRGAQVLLIDATNGRKPSPGESLHGVAASSLAELGLWPSFLRQRFQRSYLAEIAWESAELRERRAIDHVWGPEYHLDRCAFDAWLVDEAVGGGAERLQCSELESATFDHAAQLFRCAVLNEHGMTAIVSHALVDATGRSAAAMRRLGGRIVTDSDRLIAVSRTYLEPLPQRSVLIETTDNGWWYSAPLPAHRSLAIWFTDADLARGRASRPEYFEASLQASIHTRARFAGSTPDARLSVCAAGPSLTAFDPALPALPVGDAVAAFDPISGDGLCFALRSALDAADTIVQHRAGNRDAIASYATGVEAVFARHVTRRAKLYEEVLRFGESPFWSRARGSHHGAVASHPANAVRDTVVSGERRSV